VTIAKNKKMVGDFSGILNLVGDRSPMTPMVAKPLMMTAVFICQFISS